MVHFGNRVIRALRRPDWSAGVAGATFALALSLSGAMAQSGAHTPTNGSVERKAILDAMRLRGDNHKQVFVVRHLKVSEDWAWVTVDPKSADGAQQYEPESALLRRTGSRWRVVDQPCGEEGCDEHKELLRIRAKYRAAPAAIFPD